MAEFQEVMAHFKRMCEYNQHKQECPMGCIMSGMNRPQCMREAFEKPKTIEKTIMAWAAEHPVVYPTWWEWLFSIGAVTYKVKPDVAATLIDTGLLDTIPADIAEKLGIEPKEDI